MSEFYYRGVLFSDKTEDVYNAWGVDKINDIRLQIIRENYVSGINENDIIYVITPINKEYGVLCEYCNYQIYLGIYDYNNKSFVDVNISQITNISDSCMYDVATAIGRYAKAICNGIAKSPIIKVESDIYNKWIKHKTEIEQSPIEKVDSTVDAKYIIEKDSILHTADELKTALNGKSPHYKVNSYFDR